jgi:hypothetical protein
MLGPELFLWLFCPYCVGLSIHSNRGYCIIVPFVFVIYPDPFPSVLGSVSVSYSKEHNKINPRENATTYVCWLVPGGPTDKENLVKM